MSRVRISTTVDGDVLQRCRTLLHAVDSELLDRALRLLLEQLQAHKEIAALEAAPYEEDVDLHWQPPSGPDLAYDGEIPDDVRRLAERRRRRQ